MKTWITPLLPSLSYLKTELWKLLESSLPRNKIKEISFLINGKKTFTNSKHFSNLYEISLNEDGCNVHYTYDDKVIISFHGSYGMGSYRVFLFFDNEGEFLYKIVNLAG